MTQSFTLLGLEFFEVYKPENFYCKYCKLLHYWQALLKAITISALKYWKKAASFALIGNRYTCK